MVPVNGTYAGCDYDADGLCSFDNVLSVLQQRISEIDYDYDCFANYTATAGNDYNVSDVHLASLWFKRDTDCGYRAGLPSK